MRFSKCSQISGLMLSTNSLFALPSITAMALVCQSPLAS